MFYRADHMKQRLLSADNKNKVTWRIVNELTGDKKSTQRISPSGSLTNNANLFNNFFIDFTKNLRNTLPFDFDSSIPMNPNSIFLKPVTLNELKSIGEQLKKKRSAGLDEIPCSLLKKCLHLVADPLLDIIN